jgi:uncharacterized protein (TIGR02001 family)
LTTGIAAPANADTQTSVSIFNDLQFRGYSLSEGRPVGILDLAFDDPSGLYADAAGTGVFGGHSAFAPLSMQLTGGYARRLRSGATLDFGATHSTYSSYSGASRGTSYTELYAGIMRGGFSSRIFLSPHYFERGRWTAYGEVNGSVAPARNWSIDGHVGIHVTLKAPANESYRPEFDWRLGLSRAFKSLSLHAAWSGGAPGRDYYGGRGHSRSALIIGASAAF